MHSGSLKRTSLAAAALGATVAFVLPVSADAPISGPAQQYDNFGPNEVTIRDRKSGLRWTRPRSNEPYPVRKLADAKTYCAGLQPVGENRLPSLKELLSLVDEEPHAEYVDTRNQPRYIDRNAFLRTPDKAFWTSSEFPDGSATYTVDFRTGRVDKTSSISEELGVFCVR
ncbi:MAG: DUF1566 domain-containing protein [Labilithrix sp.]|nr:DUF1566 domain-containing protein [Labilithrix sp.]MCW5813579.1 DUF1566 domain-containing protein [Labilithrix sp.]